MIYQFACDACRREFDKDCPVGIAAAVCVQCGRAARRVFGANTIMPAWLRPENESGRARHKAFLENPETRAKLDAGIYEMQGGRNRWNSDDD